MKTHCNQKTFPFQTQNSRDVVVHFNGGNISSDGGSLLLQQAEERLKFYVAKPVSSRVERYDKTAPKLSKWMEENLPEGLTVFALPDSPDVNRDADD